MSLTATGTQLPWHDPGAPEEDRCCCGEVCCMYPASAVHDGVILLEDLPETLQLPLGGIEGFSFPMQLTRERSTIPSPWEGEPGWEAYYRGDSAGGVTIYVVLSSSATAWIWQVVGLSGEFGEMHHLLNSPCLIHGDGGYVPGDNIIEDQFEATYSLNPDWQDSIPVTRVSLCRWEGPDNFGGTAFLEYDSDEDALYWWVGCTADDTYFEQAVGTNEGPQSSPIGSYYGIPGGAGYYFGTVS